MSLKGKDRRDDLKDDRKQLGSGDLNSRLGLIGNIPPDKINRSNSDASLPAARRRGTEKDDRNARPAARRRSPPSFDDRSRRSRDYRDRSPSHRDGNSADDRARRELSRTPRNDRFRDDRLKDSYYDSARRRFDDPATDRRFGGRDDPVRLRDHMTDPPDLHNYPNDCEIIVPNKMQRQYAELIEARLKNYGMRTDLLFPHEDTPLSHVIEDISRRGCPYAIVVLPQNEQHKSTTVNILWGKPQEHRNMPLEDALNLIARSFDSYVQSGRDKTPATALRDRASEPPLTSAYPLGPVEAGVQVLLNLLAEGRPLSVPELDRVIKHLQERKERLLKEAEMSVNKAIDMIPTAAPSAVLPPDKVSHDQQAELQKRILSILNNNPPAAAGPVQPPAAALPAAASAVRGPVGGSNVSAGTNGSSWGSETAVSPSASQSVVNFDNPNVQKALDNLIQSGPALLRTIQATGPSSTAAVNAHGGQMSGQQGAPFSGHRPVQSPNQPQPPLHPAMNSNFGMRTPNQQQRHPLLGTLTPVTPGLMSRSNVGIKRF